MTDSPLGGFLDAVGKLAPSPGIVFRGLGAHEPEPPTLGVLTAPVPASADPVVAREGHDGPLLVLLTRTARDLTALSAHPQEREHVLLPGTAWVRLEVPELRPHGVVVLEEVDTGATRAPERTPAPESWPATRADLVREVERLLADHGTVAPGSQRGRYRGPWPVQPVTPSR